MSLLSSRWFSLLSSMWFNLLYWECDLLDCWMRFSSLMHMCDMKHSYLWCGSCIFGLMLRYVVSKCACLSAWEYEVFMTCEIGGEQHYEWITSLRPADVHARAHIHKYRHTHAHTHTHTFAHVQTYTPTHKQTHTQAIHVNKYTHTYTHILTHHEGPKQHCEGHETDSRCCTSKWTVNAAVRGRISGKCLHT